MMARLKARLSTGLRIGLKKISQVRLFKFNIWLGIYCLFITVLCLADNGPKLLIAVNAILAGLNIGLAMQGYWVWKFQQLNKECLALLNKCEKVFKQNDCIISEIKDIVEPGFNKPKPSVGKNRIGGLT